MVIKDFLNALDLNSVMSFKLNNNPVSYLAIRDSGQVIKKVKLEINTKQLQPEHIQLVYDTDDPGMLSELINVEKQLPLNSNYTHIVLNILTEDE
jgi:hypothetical protein